MLVGEESVERSTLESSGWKGCSRVGEKVRVELMRELESSW